MQLPAEAMYRRSGSPTGAGAKVSFFKDVDGPHTSPSRKTSAGTASTCSPRSATSSTTSSMAFQDEIEARELSRMLNLKEMQNGYPESPRKELETPRSVDSLPFDQQEQRLYRAQKWFKTAARGQLKHKQDVERYANKVDKRGTLRARLVEEQRQYKQNDVAYRAKEAKKHVHEVGNRECDQRWERVINYSAAKAHERNFREELVEQRLQEAEAASDQLRLQNEERFRRAKERADFEHAEKLRRFQEKEQREQERVREKQMRLRQLQELQREVEVEASTFLGVGRVSSDAVRQDLLSNGLIF